VEILHQDGIQQIAAVHKDLVQDGEQQANADRESPKQQTGAAIGTSRYHYGQTLETYSAASYTSVGVCISKPWSLYEQVIGRKTNDDS
jgi:hypothetical protein